MVMVLDSKIMNIENNFNKIVGRDNINSLKPINESYLKFIEINKIKNKDKCIFLKILRKSC